MSERLPMAAPDEAPDGPRAELTSHRWLSPAGEAALASGRGASPLRVIAALLITILVGIWAAQGQITYSLLLGTIYAIAILGTSLVCGPLGEINLSVSCPLAAGAYGAAFGLNHSHGILISGLIGVGVAVLIGAVIAVPVIRLEGIFVALVTFAAAFAVPDLAIYLESATGGSAGTSVPLDVRLFGMNVAGTSTGLIILTLVAFVVIGLASLWILNSEWGRSMALTGEAPAAGTSFGIATTSLRFAAWLWSALVAGVAGVLLALLIGFVSPSQFSFTLGIFLFVGAMVGGFRSSWGAWIGGALVGTLPPELQSFVPSEATGIVFGVVLLIALMAGGRGISEPIERLVMTLMGGFRRWRS